MVFSNEALNKIRKHREQPTVTPLFEKYGRVVQVVGMVIEVTLSGIPLGALVRITGADGSTSIDGEVVGFRKDRALVIPFSEPVGICARSLVRCLEREQKIRVGEYLIGRIIDGYGRPMVGAEFPTEGGTWLPISGEPINPLTRRRIHQSFDTGIRAINALLTFGEGQRVGIMAGSGVGKSVLLGMISRYSEADVNVIALIGERGREVREFIEENLGEEGLKKSVVIVSTGEQSALSRVRAAHVGTAIAGYFRDTGRKVLLMMDSLTRVAMAQREIGLAVGEPPTTKGYTPSVFSLLPRLLERAGNSDSDGSLTGIYTVLVDGDDFGDPVCDAARSILDGHINLLRSLAEKNHFPAIGVLSSASRVMVDVVEREHLYTAGAIRDILAEYEKNEDLINIGAYHPGSNHRLDRAIKLMPQVEAFLRQDRFEKASFDTSLEEMRRIVKEGGGA